MHAHIVTGDYLCVPLDHNKTLEEVLQWWITNDQHPSWDKLISTVACFDDGMEAGIKMCERLSIRYVVLVHIRVEISFTCSCSMNLVIQKCHKPS